MKIDWNGPLEVARGSILPVKLWIDDGDCKWLEIGVGRYMFNNDGTGVDSPYVVRNTLDHQARLAVEGEGA
nr:hypothetical protein [Brucella intermedia]